MDLNIDPILEAQRTHVRATLAGIVGPKDLVLDKEVTTTLNYVCGFSFLQTLGVARIFPLESRMGVSERTRVYIVRAHIVNMKLIAEHLHADARAGRLQTLCHVLLVPRFEPMCAHLLEEEGVYGSVKLHPLQLDLIPSDTDLLSMQCPGTFKTLQVYQDPSPVHSMVNALIRMEKIYGLFARVVGCGPLGVTLAKLLLEHNTSCTETANVASEFDAVIIFDRAIDLVSLVSSQLIYAGLVDESFGIEGGCVDFGKHITGTQEGGTKIMLATDDIFHTIKDMNFSQVGPILKEKARQIGAHYDERHNATDLKDLKQFVSKLGGLQSQHRSLRIHTDAAEFIVKERSNDHLSRLLDAEHSFVAHLEDSSTLEWVEELIHRQKPMISVLRLLCLYSTTHGGLKPKVFEGLKQHFLQSYGYEHLLTFSNLQRAGLFTKADKGALYPKARKRLKLLSESDEAGKSTPFVFYGHAPLSAQLVATLYRCNFQGDELAKQLGIPFSVAQQQGAPAGKPAEPAKSLIFFAGGVTCSELAALRAVSYELGRPFVFATTELINGNRLIESMIT